MRGLVVAARELRWIGAASFAAGATTLVAALIAGALSDLSALEGLASALVFGLSAAAAGGRLVLGVRTGPAILYVRIFESAPPPPPGVQGEAPRATASRATSAALATGAGLIAGAGFLLAATLLMIGEPPERLLRHLPQAAALVGAGWMLVFGIVALRVASWFRRWESRRGKVLVCPPLHSGLLRAVYYAAARARPTTGGREGGSSVPAGGT